MTIATGYLIEDVIFAAWLAVLILCLARNFYLERNFLPVSEPKLTVRYINRTSLIFLSMMVLLSVDFRDIHNAYGRAHVLRSLGYGYSTTSLMASASLYLYFTLKAAVLSSSTHLTEEDERTIRMYRILYISLCTITFIVATITASLDEYQRNTAYAGWWEAWVALAVFLLLCTFLIYSIKLRQSIRDFLDQRTFADLNVRLRTVQLTLTPLSLIVVVVGSMLAAENVTHDTDDNRYEDSYQARYAAWMWFMLALQCIFQYVSWLPAKSALLEMYGTSVTVQPSSAGASVVHRTPSAEHIDPASSSWSTLKAAETSTALQASSRQHAAPSTSEQINAVFD